MKADGEGEIEPMLDFLTEGRVDDEFVKTVKFDPKCFDKFEKARQEHIDSEARNAIEDQAEIEKEKERKEAEIQWRVDRGVKAAFDEIIGPEREKIEKAKKKAEKEAETAIADAAQQEKDNGGGALFLLL